MRLRVVKAGISLTILGLSLTALPTSASETGLGMISDIFSSAVGLTAFNQGGTRTAKPACATQDRWAIDTTTPAGQAMTAMLLTAYTTNRPIRIDGTGTCTLDSQFETVLNLHIG